MRSSFGLLVLAAALASAAAACAANGDGASAGGPHEPLPPSPTAAATAAITSTAAAAAAPIDARDVAVLVIEQTPTSLQVTSAARRPRSSFGPAATWNGAGTPTHRWTLLGAAGDTL